MSNVEHPPQAHRDAGHIPATIDLRRILIAGAILALLIVVVVAIVLGLYATRDRSPAFPFGPNVGGKTVSKFPAPRLQPERGEERKAYLAEQHAKATGYAWIDPSRGIVRIPVERAMQLLVEEHRRAEARKATR